MLPTVFICGGYTHFHTSLFSHMKILLNISKEVMESYRYLSDSTVNLSFYIIANIGQISKYNSN